MNVNQGSEPAELFALNNALYFSADNGVVGRELWRMSIHPAGTQTAFVPVGSVLVGQNLGNLHVADAGPDRRVAEGTQQTFTATFRDPDSTPSTPSYAWHVTAKNGRPFTVDAGTPMDTLSTSPTFRFTPLDNAMTVEEEYIVTLTLVDGSTILTDSASVFVKNVAPSFELGGNETIIEGTTFVGRVITFTDPGSDTWAAQVDYGDGSTVLTIPASELSGKTFTLNHVYADNRPTPYTVTVKINDGDGAEATDSFLVTVNNVPPQNVTIVPSGTLKEGDPVTLITTFTDADGTAGATYAWSVTASTGQVIPHSASPTVTFTPVDNGTYTVKLTVTDKDGAPSSEVVLPLTVANVAPAVNVGGDITVFEGDIVTLSSLVTDPAGTADPLTYAWSLVATNGQVLPGGTSTTYTFTPTDEGAYTASLIVADGDPGGTGSDQVVVTVLNVAPVFELGADVTLNEGSTLSRSVTFVDPGADIWTAMVNYGDGAGFQLLPLTGKTIPLSDLYANEGSYTVTVKLNDGDSPDVQDSFLVTVANVAPTFSALNLSAATIVEGNSVTVTGAIVDPGTQDAHTITINWGTGEGTSTLNLVANDLLIESADGLAHTYATPGVYTITATVSDGLGSQSVTRSMTVANLAPASLGVVGPTSVAEGQLYTATGSFVDLTNLDVAADQWTATVSYDGSAPVPLTVNQTTQTFQLQTVFLHNSLHTATVVVTDRFGAQTGPLTVNLDVTNVSPVFTALALSRTVLLQQGTVTLSGAVTDPGVFDPLSVTVDWKDGSPVEALTLASDGTFSRTHTFTGLGDYGILVTAGDGEAITPDTLPLRVLQNQGPLWNAFTAQSTVETQRFTVALGPLGTDPNGPDDTLTYSLGAGAPTGARISSTSGFFTWDPTADQGPQTYLIPVIVADQAGLEATQNLQVTVRTPDLDVDGDGVANATDARLILRDLARVPDSQLLAGTTLSSTALRTSVLGIRDLLSAARQATPMMLDVDNDGRLDPFKDGRMIARFLAGATNEELLVGSVIGVGATRTDAMAIRAFLSQFLPPVTQSANAGLSTQHAALSTSEVSVPSLQSSPLSSILSPEGRGVSEGSGVGEGSGTPLSTSQSSALKLTINSASLSTSSASLVSGPGFTVQMGGEGDDQDSPSLTFAGSQAWLRDFVVDSAVVTDDPNRDLLVMV
ncbi:MAG: PKD domain-containing protein [Nitrospirae bacterium]|nr:PKD domain-containing protein [Nitrospirota bacterium]